jgi:hypothetical protein
VMRCGVVRYGAVGAWCSPSGTHRVCVLLKRPMTTSAVPALTVTFTHAVAGAPHCADASALNVSSAANSQSPDAVDFFQRALSDGAEMTPGTSAGRSGLP